MKRRSPSVLTLSLAVLQASTPALVGAEELPVDEARAIAREAYIYGFPIVENGLSMVAFAIDQESEEYQAPLNTLEHRDPAATPGDTEVTTPNIDVAHSFMWIDLRSEPVVLSVPEVDEQRYYSIQLSDLYSYAFAYTACRS